MFKKIECHGINVIFKNKNVFFLFHPKRMFWVVKYDSLGIPTFLKLFLKNWIQNVMIIFNFTMAKVEKYQIYSILNIKFIKCDSIR